MTAKGSYALVVRLEQALEIQVGRLGLVQFPRACYVYFGSALNGLDRRIQRHLQREKILRWHIDYLTSSAPVVEVWRIADGARWECVWARKAVEQAGVFVPARGFGSSDCRCHTHLVGLASRTRVNEFRRSLRKYGGAGGRGLDIRRTVL